MQIDRHIAHAPNVRSLGARLPSLTAPCVGCAECRGLCDALLELLTLPEAVLDRGRPA